MVTCRSASPGKPNLYYKSQSGQSCTEQFELELCQLHHGDRLVNVTTQPVSSVKRPPNFRWSDILLYHASLSFVALWQIYTRVLKRILTSCE